MFRLGLCVIALGSLVTFLSCGSSQQGGACTGAGGGGGNLGVAAGGGQGGTGKVGSWRQLPCITALLAECPLEGSCTKQKLDGGSDSSLTTFASGVTVSYRASSPCDITTADGVWDYEVRRSDGSLCFSKQGRLRFTSACEVGELTIRNAGGEVVAQGSLGGQGSTLACANGGPTCGGTGGFGGADCDPPLDVSCPAGCP
jgi:hypothetical protein